MPLAGSQPARPEPRPQPELAGGSRPGKQSPPAGLRASPAPASPARPQQAPQPVAWAGAAAGSCALPRTDAGPPRHVRPSPRPAGAAPFPWFKVRAERSRGAGAEDAKDAGREAPARCPPQLEHPLQAAQQPGAGSPPHAEAQPHHLSHLDLPWKCAPGEEAVDLERGPRWLRRPEGGGGPTVPRDT